MAGKGTSKTRKRTIYQPKASGTQVHYEVTSTLHTAPHAKPIIEAHERAEDANQNILPTQEKP